MNKRNNNGIPLNALRADEAAPPSPVEITAGLLREAEARMETARVQIAVAQGIRDELLSQANAANRRAAELASEMLALATEFQMAALEVARRRSQNEAATEVK